jgi:two-component system, NarL family, invasion response regulator UvrY
MLRRILLIDDHVATREGLIRILASAFPEVQVYTVDSVVTALRITSTERFDLAITDPALAGKNGIDFLHDLKKTSPLLPVLIYTVHRRELLSGDRALRAEADGYVSKDQPVDDLMEAIERILRGRPGFSGGVAEEPAQVLLEPKSGPIHDPLSRRELQVLQLLAAGQTPSEIALDLHLSIKTVSTYRARLLEKLELRTTADLIRYAIENGI